MKHAGLPLTSIASMALVLGACASMHRHECGAGQAAAVQDSLYFGAARPQGRVTAAEWSAFLQDTVTPRFPQGLTVWEASGQWRGADGAIVREPSRVLTLIHPDDAVSERAVLEIVEAYRARFEQEAVLRVRADVCPTF